MIYDLDMNFDPDFVKGVDKHFVAACAYTDMAAIDGLAFAGTFHGTVINDKVHWIQR